jgi:hypothetical protein
MAKSVAKSCLLPAHISSYIIIWCVFTNSHDKSHRPVLDSINARKVSSSPNLLYADDVVLLAENEKDLQMMLDVLNFWCKNNALYVNVNKSKNSVNGDSIVC